MCSQVILCVQYSWQLSITFSRKQKYKHECRSSRLDVFCKKGVLRNFTKFTGKHLYESPFFSGSLSFCIFIKKESLAQVFPVNFAKFLRAPFLTEHLRWLIAKDWKTNMKKKKKIDIWILYNEYLNFLLFKPIFGAMYRACSSRITASDCRSQPLTAWKPKLLSQSVSHSTKIIFFY